MQKPTPDAQATKLFRLYLLAETAAKFFASGDVEGGRELVEAILAKVAELAPRPAPVVPMTVVSTAGPLMAAPCPPQIHPVKECQRAGENAKAPEPAPADGPGAPLVDELPVRDVVGEFYGTVPPSAPKPPKAFEPSGVLPPSRRRLLRAVVELAGGMVKVPREAFDDASEGDVFYSISSDGAEVIITSRETKQRGEGVGL